MCHVNAVSFERRALFAYKRVVYKRFVYERYKRDLRSVYYFRFSALYL